MEYEEWRQQRHRAIAGPDGILSVCGMFWLSVAEELPYGSDLFSNFVHLPDKNTPSVGGTVELQADLETVTLTPLEGENVIINNKVITQPVSLVHDGKGSPTIVHFKDSPISFFIIKRANRLAVRVRDSSSEKIALFKGVEVFPHKASYAVHGKFVKEEKIMSLANILDDVLDYVSPGTIEFIWTDGNKYTLDAILEGPTATSLWIVFSDGTSGVDTYYMRFLQVKPPEDGDNHVLLDFNLTYNPACAFSHYFVFPLPPKRNVLPYSISTIVLLLK